MIAASHTSGLAQYFSKRVQGRIAVHGDTLGSRLVGEAVESWSTSNAGEYKAVGVGGAIAGRRGDLIVVDDPMKSREEADNLLVRDRVWDWYRGDLIGRLKPTGRIVLVMTRWHHDDLAGRLLEQEPERWRVLSLPAIAEEDDALGREMGDGRRGQNGRACRSCLTSKLLWAVPIVGIGHRSSSSGRHRRAGRCSWRRSWGCLRWCRR